MDGASERLSSRLEGAGFDEAMQAALAAEPVLAADETPSISWIRMPGWPRRTRAAARAGHPHPARWADLAAGAGIPAAAAITGSCGSSPGS